MTDAAGIAKGLSSEERKLLLNWRAVGQVYVGGLMARGLVERRYDYHHEAEKLGRSAIDGKIHDLTPLGRAVASLLENPDV